MEIDVNAIIAMHDRTVLLWHEKNLEADHHELPHDEVGLHDTIVRQHVCNFRLWHIEDEARRKDVADAYIAKQKRLIDGFNQRRNDGIELIDEAIAGLWPWIVENTNLPLGTETPGSAIDRISIGSLKIFHMREQIERREIDPELKSKCAERLTILEAQRADLGRSLTELLIDLRDRRKRLRIYRQFKMYNDPRLNKAVYSNPAAT